VYVCRISENNVLFNDKFEVYHEDNDGRIMVTADVDGLIRSGTALYEIY